MPLPSVNQEHFLTFSQPFILATKNVFKSMAQMDLNLHSPQMKNNSFATGDVTISVGLRGELKETHLKFEGVLALSFNESVFLQILERILKRPLPEWNEQDVLTGAKLCEEIMTTAKADLLKTGFQCESGAPITLRGKTNSMRPPKESTIVETKVQSDAGEFSLDICYQESTTQSI
jgi:chemotaxis protein CheX